VSVYTVCVRCRRGDHHLCLGWVGTTYDHPDSAPLCECSQARHRTSDEQPVRAQGKE
jgi:hypothetical protein